MIDKVMETPRLARPLGQRQAAPCGRVSMNAGRSTTATSTPHAISCSRRAGNRRVSDVKAQSGISGHQSSGASRWNPGICMPGRTSSEMQNLGSGHSCRVRCHWSPWPPCGRISTAIPPAWTDWEAKHRP